MKSTALPAFVPGFVQRAFVVSMVLGFGVMGCAADATSDASGAPTTEGGAVDELNAQTLRGATAIKGTVEVGSTVTLQYDRESFKTISSAVAQTLPDGTAQATLDVARGPGTRFVLVRDTRWSKPMEFQVGVGR